MFLKKIVYLNPVSVLFFVFFVAFFAATFGFSDTYDSAMSGRGLHYFLLGSIFVVLLLVKIIFAAKFTFVLAPYRLSAFDKVSIVVFAVLAPMEFVIYGFPLFTGEYKDFGVPFVHVLIYGIAIYLAIRSSLNFFLSDGVFKRQSIFVFVIVLTWGVLILSRHLMVMGALIFLFSMFSTRNVSAAKLLLVGFISILLIYIFGVLGTLRMANMLDIPYLNAEQYILKAGGASDKYESIGLGPSFFWTWLYVTSPIYNLLFISENVPSFGLVGRGFSDFLLFEIIPETFSKRLAILFDIEPAVFPLVVEHLNVSTTFAGSYVYLGYFGLFVFLCSYVLFFLVAFFCLSPGLSRVALCVLFCSMSILSVFDNMLRVASIMFCVMLILIGDFFAPRNYCDK